MKKHHTDELFAAKLKNHGVTPSDRAAELFQKRLAEKQRPQGIFYTLAARKYYWAAAASVLFALGIGWYSLQETAGPTEALAATEPRSVEIKREELPERPQNLALQVPDNNEIVIITPRQNSVEKPQPKRTTFQKALATTPRDVQVATSNKTDGPFTIPTVKPMILDEPIMDKLTVAVMDAQREKNKEAAKNRKSQNDNNAVFKNSVAETVVVITEIKPTEEQMLIPEINGDSPVTVAKATQIGRERMDSERSFIAKVVTEIKHLKHGEKMDVDGLNRQSNAIFARSEEGFIATEKQEISYRLGQLKGLFAKNDLR